MEVSSFSRPEILSYCKKYAREKKGVKNIVTLNSLMVWECWKNRDFLAALKKSSLIVCDSIGVKLMVRVLEGRGVVRYPGIELMEDIVNSGVKSFFFGGKEGVALAAADRLKKKNPFIWICGTASGYFSSGEEDKIIADINKKKPEALFVGLDMARQEIFINCLKNKLNAGLIMGVGGSFDVISGQIRRAPFIFSLLGMEWFWRLIIQPWRLSRVAFLPLFGMEVLWRYLRGKLIFQV